MLGHQGICPAAVTLKTDPGEAHLDAAPRGEPDGHGPELQFTDGRYDITFTMPNVIGVGSGDAYRFVPHAPDCTFSQGPSVTDPNFPNVCESAKLNAGGVKLFQN